MSYLKPTSLSLASLLWATTAIADAPKVVTDIAPVHALVSRVMEGVGTPDLLLPPGASPHSYAMRPSEARMLNGAELFVWIGPGLTPWLDGPLDALAGDAEALSLMALPGTNLLEIREGAGFEGGHDHGHGEEGHEGHGEDKDHDDHDDHDDHAAHKDEGHDDHAAHDHEEHAEDKDHDDHGHEDHAEHAEEGHDDHKEEDHAGHGHDDHKEEDHAGHGHDDHKEEDHAGHGHEDHEGHAGDDHVDDPHVWLDPRNAQVWLPVIAEHLAELDPENAAVYAANAAAGQAELAALEEELSAQLAGIKGKPFVVFHDAYQPFEARFGVSAVASVSPSDAQKPGAGRISQVQEVVQDTGAVCGFAEPQMNPALLGVVMEGQADFTIATLDPLGVDLPLGADLYPGLLRGLADAMVGCLGAE